MYQQIGNKEHRVVLVFPNVQFHCGPILFHDNPMKGKGDGHPLVLFHAAIVMGIQIGNPAVLIEGILLDIQPRGIYMCAQDIHSLCHGTLPNAEQCHCFIHAGRIDLIPFF